jgi:hypothetical protein
LSFRLACLFACGNYEWHLGVCVRFRINPSTGLISVAPCNTPGRGSCIDYEQQSFFNLTVAAADMYGDGQPTSVSLWISVKNEIDNPPIFTTNEYVGAIHEYAATLDDALQVQVSACMRNIQCFVSSLNFTSVKMFDVFLIVSCN